MSKPAVVNLDSKATPAWLLNSKDHITGSKEWNNFVGELHDTIQQQLTESHVRQFTDLSESEKELFMERATKALQGASAYKMLYNGISSILDHQLNGEVARQLLEEFPVNTKSDMIVESAKDGAISILRKWPDFKNKLHACFNQPLPLKLREIAWKLYLDNPKVRKQYVSLLSSNPRAAISSKDFEISQRCEQILSSEPTFSAVRGSIGVFYAMKAVLSYHHALKQSKVNLMDTDFMLCVPFVYVILERIPRREPAASRVVALLVEEYLSFMRTRPRFMHDAVDEGETNEETKSYAKKIAQTINSFDYKLATAIAEMSFPEESLPPTPSTALSGPIPRPLTGEEYSPGPPTEIQPLPPTPRNKVQDSPQPNAGGNPGQNQNQPAPNRQQPPANQQRTGPGKSRGGDSFQGPGSGPSLPDGVLHLMRPVTRSLFVGYCNMDVVQYIWDQYIIGLDAPGFHNELIPAVSATFLMLLSDKLQACTSVIEMEEVLRREGPKLKVEHFQYLMNRHFYRDLYDFLAKDSKAALPVIDPTQVKADPWNQWSKEIIPPRIRPDDRRNLRLQREEERQRLLAMKKEKERQKEEERDKIRRERAAKERRGSSQMEQALATARAKDNEDKLYLQDLLKQEHQHRLDKEREADREIAHLKNEVEELKKLLRKGYQPKPSPRPSIASQESGYSVYVPPPPPTAASRVTPQNSQSPQNPQELTKQAIMEFFNRVAMGTNKLAHGEGEESSALDAYTRSNQEKLKADFLEAQRRTFGRTMDMKDMDKLPAEDRERNMHQLMEALDDVYLERKRKELTQP